jgi:hypothetical protein
MWIWGVVMVVMERQGKGRRKCDGDDDMVEKAEEHGVGIDMLIL